jgi:hypothetical protein
MTLLTHFLSHIPLLAHHLADTIALVVHEVDSNLLQLALQIGVNWLAGQ